MAKTEIVPDNSGVLMALPKPLLSPSPSVPPDSGSASSYNYLNFASFASLFPSVDQSSTAMLFRLGASLFDPINLHLGNQHSTSPIIMPSPITSDISTRVTLLRRKSSLGDWLEDAIKSNVEGDLKKEANDLVSGGMFRPDIFSILFSPILFLADVKSSANTTFIHLVGHQVEQACLVAATGGYPKLSTLISQTGGDSLFKNDIQEQLRIWKSENLNPSAGVGFGNGLIERGVWKIHCLLGGILDDEDELADKLAGVCSGLDWKRIFGLCLWYGQGIDAPISKVIEAYENLVFRQSNLTSSSSIYNNNKAKPLPPWLLHAQRTGHPAVLLTRWKNMMASFNTTSEPNDPLYALIKLYADPDLSLSNTLNPFSFSSSLLESGIPMCWHLYIILSRVMRVRDFADRRPAVHSFVNGGGREGSDEDGNRCEKLTFEGYSSTADLLSSAYAFELENLGMIPEAIFVLLHLECSKG